MANLFISYCLYRSTTLSVHEGQENGYRLMPSLNLFYEEKVEFIVYPFKS